MGQNCGTPKGEKASPGAADLSQHRRHGGKEEKPTLVSVFRGRGIFAVGFDAEGCSTSLSNAGIEAQHIRPETSERELERFPRPSRYGKGVVLVHALDDSVGSDGVEE